MRPLPMSFNWLTRSTSSQAQLFPWKISKSANAVFRFPTTGGWLLPETTMHFFSCIGKTRSSLVNFSPSQLHHYRSFNDTSCTFPCNLDALPLFSPFCLTFPLQNDRPRAQQISVAWHFSSFTQQHTFFQNISVFRFRVWFDVSTFNVRLIHTCVFLSKDILGKGRYQYAIGGCKWHWIKKYSVMNLTENVLLHETFVINPSNIELNLVVALYRDKVFTVNERNRKSL